MVDNKMKLLVILLLAGLSIASGGLSSSSSKFIDTVLSAQNVTFLKSKDILIGKKELPNMGQFRTAIIKESRVFLIDFTDTNGTEYEDSLKQILLRKMAIHFPCNLLIVTRHKDSLLFTPVDDVPRLLTKAQLRSLMKRSTDPASHRTKGSQRSSKHDEPVPNISFYLHIQKDISESECSFEKSPDGFVGGKRNFCKDPHISLIFQVNLERSLEFGISGSATPDAKIVRISADADTGGAGIHLNNELTHHEYYAELHATWNYYWRDWSASAIAADYSVDIQASNKRAQVLKTVPENNLNPETEIKEVSGFTLGVSGEGEVSMEGPKAKLSASASYNQQRSVTVKTHDYKLERLTDGAQNIKFKMARETYAKASSLMNRESDAVWADLYPVDLKRVEPMGYASFVPKQDVIYKASKDESGSTEFSVTASVGIMPLYHAAYHHFYLFAHQSYHGTDYDRKGTQVSSKKVFTVNWEHVVFTGGRPVNLQSKAFADKCIEVDNNGKISLAKGDISSEKQSFIYDHVGRYVTASNVKMCLDASNLDEVKPCSTSLEQRWEWEDGSDHLTNVYFEKNLGYDKSTGKLGLMEKGDDAVNTRTVTTYTEVFSSSKKT